MDKDVPLIVVSIGVAFLGLIIGMMIEPPHTECSCTSVSTMAGVLGLIGLFGTPFVLVRAQKSERLKRAWKRIKDWMMISW